jgi:hypothetical protein
MKKIVLSILIGTIIFTLSGIATAAMLIPAADKAKEKTRIENSPIIEKVDDHLVLNPPGLGKIVFIHYKKGFAKPPWAGGGKEPACYDFLGKWVKWKELPVSYVIDPTNPQGLTEDFVVSAISAGAEEWDYWTGAELFNDVYSIVYDGSWDLDAPDGRNEFLFGDYPKEEVIAVTVVWGYFSGPPESREIIEFDVMFDIDYLWGDATFEPNIMDLQNIATHEIGHGVGLDDVYDTACVEVTMYGYSDYGEINKRDLEEPDITGIQELYGSF